MVGTKHIGESKAANASRGETTAWNTPSGEATVGNAELQLGNNESHWHSRGYIPHFERKACLQSITFRLADSLPQSKLNQLQQIFEALPDGTNIEQAKREQIEAWLDAGAGCCALQHPRVAQIVENALLHFDGDRYKLISWCVMPNHVHVLIEPKMKLSKIIQSWKSYTGRWAKKHNAELELGVPTNRPFWMREYWDRYIRNSTHLNKVIDYIHNNPVVAKLCQIPEEWPYSSASQRRNKTSLEKNSPLGAPSSSSAN